MFILYMYPRYVCVCVASKHGLFAQACTLHGETIIIELTHREINAIYISHVSHEQSCAWRSPEARKSRTQINIHSRDAFAGRKSNEKSARSVFVYISERAVHVCTHIYIFLNISIRYTGSGAGCGYFASGRAHNYAQNARVLAACGVAEQFN